MVRLYLYQKGYLIEVIVFILRKHSLEFFLSNSQKVSLGEILVLFF